MSLMVADPANPFENLSEIDRVLLRGAAVGLSSKQMAPMVSRSPHTIDDRLKALKKKLGAEDRFHAGRMLLAHEAGSDPLKDWGAQALGLGGSANPSERSSKRGTIDELAEEEPPIDRHGAPRLLSAPLASADTAYRRAALAGPAGPADDGRAGHLRSSLSSDQDTGKRRAGSELGRDRTTVSGSGRPLGSAERGVPDLGGSPDGRAGITGEDDPVAAGPGAVLPRSGRRGASFGNREISPDAIDAARLAREVLLAALVSAAIIFLLMRAIASF